jgi:hypothetical protein
MFPALSFMAVWSNITTPFIRFSFLLSAGDELINRLCAIAKSQSELPKHQ